MVPVTPESVWSPVLVHETKWPAVSVPEATVANFVVPVVPLVVPEVNVVPLPSTGSPAVRPLVVATVLMAVLEA